MGSIAVLTISGKTEDKEDMVEIVEDASSYFPTDTWDDIRYIGKLSLEHDFKIATNSQSYGVFLFQKLIERIRKVRESNRLVSLLLGITSDPIVALHYFFDKTNFKRWLYLVHDYVDEKAGVVSLFQVEEETSSKLVAHGLGHNRGLRHHVEPIDLMYSELLKSPILQVDGFCEVCLRKLAKDKTAACAHSH
jgi:predicted Zn-dependent protease